MLVVDHFGDHGLAAFEPRGDELCAAPVAVHRLLVVGRCFVGGQLGLTTALHTVHLDKLVLVWASLGSLINLVWLLLRAAPSSLHKTQLVRLLLQVVPLDLDRVNWRSCLS